MSERAAHKILEIFWGSNLWCITSDDSFLWPLIVLHNEGEIAAISEKLLRWLEVGPLAKKRALRSDDTMCSPGLHRCRWQLAVQSHGHLPAGDLLFHTSPCFPGGWDLPATSSLLRVPGHRLLTSWWISPSLSLKKPDSHHPKGTWDSWQASSAYGSLVIALQTHTFIATFRMWLISGSLERLSGESRQKSDYLQMPYLCPHIRLPCFPSPLQEC